MKNDIKLSDLKPVKPEKWKPAWAGLGGVEPDGDIKLYSESVSVYEDGNEVQGS